MTWLPIPVLTSRRPGMALLGALLFALFDALELRLQQSGSGMFGVAVPYQVVLVLPYLLSIAALVLVPDEPRVRRR